MILRIVLFASGFSNGAECLGNSLSASKVLGANTVVLLPCFWLVRLIPDHVDWGLEKRTVGCFYIRECKVQFARHKFTGPCWTGRQAGVHMTSNCLCSSCQMEALTAPVLGAGSAGLLHSTAPCLPLATMAGQETMVTARWTTRTTWCDGNSHLGSRLLVNNTWRRLLHLLQLRADQHICRFMQRGCT